MKKTLLIFTLLGFFVLSACQEKPKPETMDQTPTMEQALTEAADPNDHTTEALVGELMSLDNSTKGDFTALTPETATKMAEAGAMLIFNSNSTHYIVINKADNTVATANLAPLAGKKIALYGMVKNVEGVNFFIMEKAEEAK